MVAAPSSYASFIYGRIFASHQRVGATSPSSLSPRTTSPKCSWRASNTIGENTLQIPCGNHSTNTSTCCSAGNTCYQDGLCGFPVGQSVGYYIGGCTDSAYQAPQCNMNCTDLAYQNVMWNDTLQLWACCTALPSNASAFNCTQPFKGPAPVDLAATFTIPATASTPASTAAPNVSAAPTAAATATATPTPDSMGAGAKAGIGVAVVLAIGAACLGAWLVSRRRRRGLDANTSRIGARAWVPHHELPAGDFMSELDSGHHPASKHEASPISSMHTSKSGQGW